MAVFALSITKRIAYRGGQQEFSNVYHYKTLSVEAFNDNNVMDDIIGAEREIHSNEVTFVVARTWGPTDGPASASVTRVIRDLSGVGTHTPDPNFPRENAFLVSWPLGRYGSRNRPQFLRKWVHSMTAPGLAPATANNGGVAITTFPSRLPTYITDVTEADNGVGDVLPLCSASGKVPIGPGVAYRFLEHRELGNQWR